ncbi:hypothetical protein [Candidatus Endomicrobiellum trichonymphae]
MIIFIKVNAHQYGTIVALIKKCWRKGRISVSHVIPERIGYLEKYA